VPDPAGDRALLRALPAVEKVLSHPELLALSGSIQRDILKELVRDRVDQLRENVQSGRLLTVPTIADIIREVQAAARDLLGGGLRPVINATGTLLHTNLGRAKISAQVAQFAQEIATSYADLEIDLESGKRGNRYKALRPLLGHLTKGEDSLAVNNNAAAVLLAVGTLAKDREVIVSRGELVEIGGAFRVPEIVRAAGATLVEVGTTNRTRAVDYERAITSRTGLLLKTHTSNYRIVGFTKSTTTEDLVRIGKEHSVPVFEDLGSGSFVDLARYGLTPEPTVAEVVGAGVDLVSFSTDKLLGGPQGGILVGKAPIIRKLKANHLLRALRIDKVTMALLARTLALYLAPGGVDGTIPFYWAISRKPGQIQQEVEEFLTRFKPQRLHVRVEEGESRVGGGACPTDRLPTRLLVLSSPGSNAEALARRLRLGSPAVLGRLHGGKLHLDFRTIFPEDRDGLLAALQALDA
jgi:L-seryl-tRNA(Ser) seleniumtransferase